MRAVYWQPGFLSIQCQMLRALCHGHENTACETWPLKPMWHCLWRKTTKRTFRGYQGLQFPPKTLAKKDWKFVARTFCLCLAFKSSVAFSTNKQFFLGGGNLSVIHHIAHQGNDLSKRFAAYPVSSISRCLQQLWLGVLERLLPSLAWLGFACMHLPSGRYVWSPTGCQGLMMPNKPSQFSLYWKW